MPTNLNNLDPKVMPGTGKGFFSKSKNSHFKDKLT